MLKTILSAATYLFIPLSVFSQPSYPRDTSFTIQTTYRKEIQYRPYIRIAEAPVSRRIHEQYGVSYKRIGDRALTLDIFSPKNSANKKYPGIILIQGEAGAPEKNHRCIPWEKILRKGDTFVTP